jgi:hypothetical protein
MSDNKPEVPLMRAEDVNTLFQEGGTGVVGVALWKEGTLDWLCLNEGACSREDNPFLLDWPNLLVVAAPWKGTYNMPEMPNVLPPIGARGPEADLVTIKIPRETAESIVANDGSTGTCGQLSGATVRLGLLGATLRALRNEHE